MDTPSNSSLVISKKTGALVFFVGCAVGLIISEILVGVASQKAQQDARRASVDYIEQVRSGGNGSFTVKQQVQEAKNRSHRKRHHDADLSPGEHLEAVQTGILLTRTGTAPGQATLERTVHQLEKQKLRHQLEAEHKAVEKKQDKTTPHSKVDESPTKTEKTENLPDTIGLIRVRGSGNDGVLAHICSGRSDVNCRRIQLKTPRRRIKRHIHRKRQYDMRAATTNKVVALPISMAPIKQSVASSTATSTPQTTTTTMTSTVTSQRLNQTTTRDLRRLEGPLKPIRKTSLFQTRGSKRNGTVAAVKTHKPRHVKKRRKQVSADQTTVGPVVFVFNDTNVFVSSKTKTIQRNRKNSKKHQKRIKSEKTTTIAPAARTTELNTRVSTVTWGGFPFRLKANKTRRNHAEHPKSSPTSQVWSPSLSDIYAKDDSRGLDSWEESDSSRNIKSSMDLPVASVFNQKVHKLNVKSERACRRMMKDMETFEKDEQQKSEELMMVSFRDGVDEVQNLMHTWVKTPVHVMEGITFFSILICLVLYWVEDSIQSRLRKIGFNV